MVSRDICDMDLTEEASDEDPSDPHDPVSFYFVEGCRATLALVKFLRSRNLFRSELVAYACDHADIRKAVEHIPFRTYSPGPYLAHNIICWNWAW